MEAQFQIRQNAMELQDYMSDLLQWEQSIKEKEKDNNKQQKSNSSKQNKTQKSICGSRNKKSASQHTYEHYKEKWEKFNVEAALDDVDNQEKIQQQCQQEDDQQENVCQETDMPQPRSLPVDAEGWRQRGNEFFKLQNHESAMECYDRSICLQPSHLAYANRGLVRYKRGDYATSIADLNEAIEMDSKYVKAYQRRSASQKALNNFQQAAQDIEFALRLEPENKGILKERDDCVKQFLKQRGIENFEGGAWDDVSNVKIVGRDQNQSQFDEIDGLKYKEINSEEKIKFVSDKEQQEQWQKIENSLENEQNEQNEQNKQKQYQNIKQENVNQKKVEERFQDFKNESKAKQQFQNTKQENFSEQKVENSFENQLDGSNLQQDEVKQIVQEGETDEQKMKAIEQTSKQQDNQPRLQTGNYDDSNQIQVKSEQRKLKVVDDNTQRKSKEVNHDNNITSNFKFNSEQLIQQFAKNKSQMTSVDFEMKWKNIGGDLQKRVEFLWQISDSDFPKILKSSLTPQLLESIVSAVLSGMIEMDQTLERANGIQILNALTKVERFGMTVMCINNKIKKQWGSDWEEIIRILNSEDQVQFQNVRKKYRI